MAFHSKMFLIMATILLSTKSTKDKNKILHLRLAKAFFQLQEKKKQLLP